MSAIVGHRSPIEQEHDLLPVHVLVIPFPELVFGGAVEVAADEVGAIPAWDTRTAAEVAAAEVLAQIPDLPIVVAECWRPFIAETLLAADGRDPAELSDGDVEAIVSRTYLVEARSFDAADAVAESREVGRRIARGLENRFLRLIGEAA